MPNANINILVGRNDTILGVCEAISQDFGINALVLRLAFIVPLFFQPMATIGVYLALGVLVAISRLTAPDKAVAAPQPVAETAIASRETDEALAIAA